MNTDSDDDDNNHNNNNNEKRNVTAVKTELEIHFFSFLNLRILKSQVMKFLAERTHNTSVPDV